MTPNVFMFHNVIKVQIFLGFIIVREFIESFNPDANPNFKKVGALCLICHFHYSTLHRIGVQIMACGRKDYLFYFVNLWLL